MGITTDRREVLKGLVAAGLLAGTAGAQVPGVAEATPVAGRPVAVPTTTLGKKAIPITRFAVGGWHAGVAMGEEEAKAMLDRAFTLGVRFFDSAYSYGGSGESERRLGEVFASRRAEVVLMSKSYQRDAAGAERELETSLKRMKTDHLELWQFHSINSLQDAERIAAPGGAAEAARRALADGRIKVLGATSHNSPEGLLRILELVPEVEVLQFPINCVDLHWKSFIQKTLPVANAKKIDVLAMKTLAMGNLAGVRKISVAEAHRYALSQPITAWVSGVESVAQLEENLAELRNHRPMSEAEQRELVARSAPFQGAKTESYKNW